MLCALFQQYRLYALHFSTLWVVAGNDAISRFGAIRLQSCNEWEWHPCLSAPGTEWKEAKALGSRGMPVVLGGSWIFNFYHRLGCFFLCENGLRRSEEETKRGLMSMALPPKNIKQMNAKC